MYHNEREREIIKILAREKYVTVKQLSGWLYSSESSIRRDLASLEKQGVVKRSYGGAELTKNSSQIIPFITRAHSNVSAKKIMARKAAQLIHEGDIVFLDQSSSAYFIANEIIKLPKVTVVTNNIEIIALLSQSETNVISSGGNLSRSNRNCLMGSDAQKIFRDMHADILFFSAKSLSRDGIIYDCEREEVCLRNVMLANAEKKVFLCASEKYDHFSGYRQCSIADIDYIITETSNLEMFKDLEDYQHLVH